jgi:uncharacterized RDD family membrane protein YckC
MSTQTVSHPDWEQARTVLRPYHDAVNVDRGIVTPEGVVLQFSTADVGSRLVAKLIDLAIQGALLTALLLASAAIGSVIRPVGLAGLYLSIFIVVLVYPAAFETLWRGRTPGKAALGLRVVTVEGSPIRFRHAAIRAMLGLIDFYLLSGAVAILTTLFTSKNQRLGDLLAGTMVLRERTGAAQSVPATFYVPPGYESYAATLDVAGLSAADYGAVRAFLLRAASLQPAQRYDLARQIATSLLPRLHHTPPPSVSPEALLVCVAAVYQYRQRRLEPITPASWQYPATWQPPVMATPTASWPQGPSPPPLPPPASVPPPNRDLDGFVAPP